MFISLLAIKPSCCFYPCNPVKGLFFHPDERLFCRADEGLFCHPDEGRIGATYKITHLNSGVYPELSKGRRNLAVHHSPVSS